METIAKVAGAASLLAFAGFFANVVLGALRHASFLSDKNEMLLLFAASTLFVVLVLVREKLAKRNNPTPRDR